MTKAQRQVVRRQLLDEKAVLSRLRKDYKEALSRVDSKIQELMGRQDLTPSVIYQVRYQRMVKGQIEEALGNLRSGACQHISDYTEGAYKTAFIGAQYSMQKQGVPLIFPIDRDAMVKAVKTDSKLSSSMYRRMGVNVTELRNSVSAELSRGIASGSGYADIARSIDGKFDIGMKNSMRIAQTEGHRISQESALDAMRKAKEAGADVVKQWDSTLDDRTRESHRELNGQIRDIDDYFETGDGHKALAPGQFGIPGEDINCRCVILQRARWAVEDGEGSYTKASRMEENGRCRIVDMSSVDGYQAFWNRYQTVIGKILKTNKRSLDSEMYPKTLAGVIRGKPMSFEEADHQRVNPHLLDSPGYMSNCQSCVVAYEARRRGYDVETLANFKNRTAKMLSTHTNYAWIDPKTGKHPKYIRFNGDTVAGLESFIDRTIESGKRYTFEFTWKGKGFSGHIVHMFRAANGEVNIFDPQTGKLYDWKGVRRNFLLHIKFSGIYKGKNIFCPVDILRVDNMAFDKNVVSKIMKAAGS